MKAIIIHGAYGNPEENWFPWLRRELEALGFEAFVPRFPTPEGQSLENWMKILEECREFDKNTTVIGHSLGCAFILRKLETLRNPINSAFLVAGFVGKLGNEKFDRINSSFFERDFDWERIRKNCAHFEVFHSDNDPYVSLEKGRELAEKLGAKFILVRGADHFNEKAGYTEFPLLLERIKDVTHG